MERKRRRGEDERKERRGNEGRDGEERRQGLNYRRDKKSEEERKGKKGRGQDGKGRKSVAATEYKRKYEWGGRCFWFSHGLIESYLYSLLLLLLPGSSDS